MNTKRLAATLLTTAALVGGSVSAATTSGPVTGTGSGTGGGVHGDLPVVTGATKITFPAGSTRATVNAKIGPQDRAAHTFSATKGQRARIQLDGSSTGAFTLTAPDGSRQLTLTIRRCPAADPAAGRPTGSRSTRAHATRPAQVHRPLSSMT